MSAPPSPLPASSAPPPAQAGVKAPRRRGAIDTLIARDQTAVFWFLVACAVAAGCGYYLVIMAEALKARPPFVVMDGSGAYYVTPGINYDSYARPGVNYGNTPPITNPMHAHLTLLAVETMFERGPKGLTHADRMGKLFTKKGADMLRSIIRKEDPYFVSQEVQQTYQVDAGSPKVLLMLPTAVSMSATGTVKRTSVFKGQPKVEIYRFNLTLFFSMNPDMRRNRAYPSVVDKIHKYELEKISDS